VVQKLNLPNNDMNETQHLENLKLASELMDELDIRKGLREKLFYLYPNTFKLIHSVLNEAEEFDWLIQQHSVQVTMDGKLGTGDRVTIYLHEEISFNTQLILQDVIDDYWACCSCFQNGFTKQAQAIMRSTLELIIQLFYLKHLNQCGTLSSDSWVRGQRGIEKYTDKVEIVKKMEALRKSNLGNRLGSLYDRLCTATHSRKDRLASWNLPRSMTAKDMPSFEPIEILYTKSLFSSVLNLELSLLRLHFEEEPETFWIKKIRSIIDSMLAKLSGVKTCIENFEKGYIIHREHVRLADNKQILYSITLDKMFEFPSRKKPKFTEEAARQFRKMVERRLVKDLK
jgi:hypothetical protein